MAAASTSSSSSSVRAVQQKQQKPLDKKAILVMVLLAVQFGLQPILTKRYTPPTANKSTVILCQEVVKFCLAFVMLYMSGETKAAFHGWSIGTWISVAGIPAALYAIQNVAALMAYQNLDALTFNVLNQTKTLSAAFCCYLVMGRKQSSMQILALFLLLCSALIMERILTIDWLIEGSLMMTAEDQEDDTAVEFDEREGRRANRHWTHGVAPVLCASFLSGLAGALSQKNLQSTTIGGSRSGSSGGRNPFLFSMELCAASSLILALSLLLSSDDSTMFTQLRHGGVRDLWETSREIDWAVLIPIVTNAIGGILVGLVTKYAGSVRKGFALIFGILLSGLWQSERVSTEQVVGGILAALSLWIHATNPPTTAIAAGGDTRKKNL